MKLKWRGSWKKLTLVHSGFEAFTGDVFDMLTSHDKGWDQHFTRLRVVAS